MPTYNIETMINPTSGLLATLATASSTLATAINNNEVLIETGFSNKQHVLWDRLIADITQATNTITIAYRSLNKT